MVEKAKKVMMYFEALGIAKDGERDVTELPVFTFFRQELIGIDGVIMIFGAFNFHGILVKRMP